MASGSSIQIYFEAFIFLSFSLAKEYAKVFVRRNSVKKMFLKISQNSQENTCAGASFQ